MICLASDVLMKKHKIAEIHWLFDTFNATNQNLVPHTQLVSEIKQVIRKIEDIQCKLKHPCLSGTQFNDFGRQEEILLVRITSILISRCR